MQTSRRTIVIIGGGFSGSVLAASLLRHPPAVPTHIVLVERQARVGCGVAYAPTPFPHLLNVPAGRMSATTDGAAQLIGFARRRIPDVCAQSFLPRQLYGEYLQDLLRTAELTASAHVRLERVHAEAVGVHAGLRPGPLLVNVGARQLPADQVVLACGDPAPTDRDYAADIGGHPAYVRDAHRQECVRPSDRAVLLIGTGLTMADVAVAAAARNPAVQITAISCHGLLPHVQGDVPMPVLDAGPDPNGRPANTSLRALVAAVRALAHTAQQRGGDWREAVTRVREAAPALWGGMDETQRRRFLRHVRVYWDIHRHRMAPQVAAEIDALRRDGRLRLRAGCVQQLCAEGDRIVALWRARGRFDTQELWVDRVVECSGADHRLARTTDVLWRNLLDAGLAVPDAMGLGLRTGRLGALIGADGRADPRLFYLGPMLRADYWEATAVGELRLRAQQLTEALASADHADVQDAPTVAPQDAATAAARGPATAPAGYSPVCYMTGTDSVTSGM